METSECSLSPHGHRSRALWRHTGRWLFLSQEENANQELNFVWFFFMISSFPLKLIHAFFPDFIELSICVLWKFTEPFKNNYFEFFVRQFIVLHIRGLLTEKSSYSFDGVMFSWFFCVFLVALHLCLLIKKSGHSSRLYILVSVEKDIHVGVGMRVLTGWNVWWHQVWGTQVLRVLDSVKWKVTVLVAAWHTWSRGTYGNWASGLWGFWVQ